MVWEVIAYNLSLRYLSLELYALKLSALEVDCLPVGHIGGKLLERLLAVGDEPRESAGHDVGSGLGSHLVASECLQDENISHFERDFPPSRGSVNVSISELLIKN